MGDRGVVLNPSAKFEAEVTDSTRPMEDLIVLHCKLVKGEIKIGDTVDLRVDEERRADIARNHSATHLLQASLRKLLGEHIQQKGSLVTPDRLRFDFTHLSPVSDAELLKVEILVNKVIRQNHEISTRHMAYAEAVKTGAMALFGEKYGEVVRLVDMGGFSKELCGGTHCSRTGDIGLCKIVSESSVAAGVRRIEALTGRAAVEYMQTHEKLVKESAALFKVSPEELADRVSKLMEENKKLRQDLRQARIGSAGPDLDQLISRRKDIDGVRVLGCGG